MLAGAETVPGTTLQTILAFATFIVPGFLLRSGYVRTRARGSVEADLYAIAEAVVGSLFILALAWWWKAHDVLDWARRGELSSHENSAYWFFLALLALPYPLGMAIGWVVGSVLERLEGARSTRTGPKAIKFFRLLDKSSLLHLPTVWDQAWNEVTRGAGSLLILVRTRSGGQIVGTIERGSWVGLSPEPRDIYMRRVYRESADGKWHPSAGTEGALVDASAVESVEFLDPTAGADSRGAAGEAVRELPGSSNGDDTVD